MKEPCRKLKIIIIKKGKPTTKILIYFKNGKTQYFYAEMLNHDFITKGAFLWEDPDLDL